MTNQHIINKVFDGLKFKYSFRTTPEIERMIQEILAKLEGKTETEKWHRLIRIVYPIWNGGSREEVEVNLRMIREGRAICPKVRREISLEECEGCKEWEREACEELKEEWKSIGYCPLTDE